MESDKFVVVSNKKKDVQTILRQDFGFTIFPSSGDGHCILHSFQNSWQHQLSSSTKPSMEAIINGIFVECVLNRQSYVPFTNLSVPAFVSQMKSYLLNRQYSSAFCDVVPLILSNAFQVGISVLNNVRGKLFTYEITPFSGSTNGHICVYRSSDHYSGLRPSVSQAKDTIVDTHCTKSTVPTCNKFSPLNTDQHLNDPSYLAEFPSIVEAAQIESQQKQKLKKEARQRKLKRNNHKAVTKSGNTETLVIGTSHVRGVGLSLNRKKINALSFCNPGCNISHISSRIHKMIPQNFQGRIVLQVGGNDCTEVHSEMVIYKFEALLFLIRQHAPECTIFISEIPQRRGNDYTSYKISTVNNFLHHLSLFEHEVYFIEHSHLRSTEYIKADGVHMSQTGYELYIDNLCSCLSDFHLVPTKLLGT